MQPTAEQLKDPTWWRLNAPTWAKAIVTSHHADAGHPVYFIEEWGVLGSKRQKLGSQRPDTNECNSVGDHCWLLLGKRPWGGEGLPPVGTVCEVYHCDEWLQGEVIAHFQQRAGVAAAYTVEVGSVGSGIKHLDSAIAECFRPIRTPEQIAVEEREKAVTAMLALDPPDQDTGAGLTSRKHFCGVLYDAGYRLVEGGAQ